MPEGEYCPVAALQYGIEVMVASDFPSHRRTNNANQQKEKKVGYADYDAVAQAEAGEGRVAVYATLKLFGTREH